MSFCFFAGALIGQIGCDALGISSFDTIQGRSLFSVMECLKHFTPLETITMRGLHRIGGDLISTLVG